MNGSPPGRPNLAGRIRNILEGDEPLPKRIAETIEKAVGEGKKSVDAVVIVALLQALQGDKPWANWLSHNGYGTPVGTLRHQVDAENSVQSDDKLAVVLVRPKESQDG